jgi:triacylglycerol esterase/lipase EstA (alpha/beta hydrolase family)
MRSQQKLNHHGTQVMRMQQIATASMLVAAIIWLVQFWPTAPWLAIWGSLACLMGYSTILAVEFIALAFVNQSDPAPQAKRLDLFYAWWAETCVAGIVFCWRQPFKANEVPDQLKGDHLQGQRGVVFIHGLMCNRGFWTPWLQLLRIKGEEQRAHAFTAVSLEPVFAGIDNYMDQIDKAVQLVTQASGLAPILVCHSMGGLAARAWLNHQTVRRVHRVVTIGTPHHGTWLARFAHGPSGLQMRQGSDWLWQLDQRAVKTESALFTCWYSNCDNIVFPTSTAMLTGASNRFVPGAAHLQLAFLPEVMASTLAMIMQDPNEVETQTVLS